MARVWLGVHVVHHAVVYLPVRLAHGVSARESYSASIAKAPGYRQEASDDVTYVEMH